MHLHAILVDDFLVGFFFGDHLLDPGLQLCFSRFWVLQLLRQVADHLLSLGELFIGLRSQTPVFTPQLFNLCLEDLSVIGRTLAGSHQTLNIFILFKNFLVQLRNSLVQLLGQ